MLASRLHAVCLVTDWLLVLAYTYAKSPKSDLGGRFDGTNYAHVLLHTPQNYECPILYTRIWLTIGQTMPLDFIAACPGPNHRCWHPA